MHMTHMTYFGLSGGPGLRIDMVQACYNLARTEFGPQEVLLSTQAPAAPYGSKYINDAYVGAKST